MGLVGSGGWVREVWMDWCWEGYFWVSIFDPDPFGFVGFVCAENVAYIPKIAILMGKRMTKLIRQSILGYFVGDSQF